MIFFLVISTSGNSKNILKAVTVAKAKGAKTIALTGKTGGKMKDYFDITIKVPETETYKIQELHLPIYHAICLQLEDIFMSNSQVTLVLTERCNYRCDMCGLVFLDSDKSREELKLNEIINIFEQSLNLFEIDEVFLTGGEIFIRDDIFDIIGYFLKKIKS